MRHLKQVKEDMTDDKDRTLTIHTEDVSVEVEPDRGTEINVTDENQFKALINRAGKELTLNIEQNKVENPSERATCERLFYSHHKKQDLWGYSKVRGSQG